MMRWRILLADDHAVVLEGLRRILDRSEFEIVGAVKDGRTLVEAAAKLHPDVIVTDVSMPSLNGVEAVQQIRKHNPKAKIIFLTMHLEPVYAVQALNAGASGYVLKNDAGEELISAIREVLDGKTYVAPSLAEPVMQALQARRRSSQLTPEVLTARQREVLQLLAEGRTPKQIAALLKVSYRTVEFHKYSIMDRLGLRTVAALAAYAAKRGIVE